MRAREAPSSWWQYLREPPRLIWLSYAGGSSETLLHMNLQTIGIRKEQTVNAITALARRKELGGPGGTLWKILSNEYRPTLLKKNEPGDYILWALNHPTEFENTYNGTLKKLVRGR